MLKLLIFVVLALCACARAYNILCVFPVPSHSHNSLGKAAVDILLKAGHNVTWVTPYPEKAGKVPASLKLIDVSPVKEFAGTTNLLDPNNVNFKNGFKFVREFSKKTVVEVLRTPSFIEAVTTTQYDAVITEQFITHLDAGIAAIQQAPWIVLSGLAMNPKLETMVDDVRSVATVPLMFNKSPIPMGLKSRLINAFLYVATNVIMWFEESENNSVYEEMYAPLAAARGIPLPSLFDAVHNVSVMFVNSHESLSPAFVTPPNVVNIAGYHIDQNPPPLPKDLQVILDNSPQGVVYFSMGSVLRSAALPQKTREELLKVFGSLKQTVLWKFEEELGELPKNVHVRSWFPQLSVLGHPNVKLFITHGGLLSSLEAVHTGVPLLAVPVFGDQPSNAERATNAGYALTVSFSPDLAPELQEKLNEMLRNDSYSQQAKHLSKLFRARPVHPNDLVKHYTELAIETKAGANNKDFGLSHVMQVAREVYSEVLSTAAVKEALVHTQYDAVFTEKFFTDLDAGLAAVQQVPWLVFSSVEMGPPLEALVDEVRSVPTVPSMYNNCPVPMGLLDRAINLYFYVTKAWEAWQEVPQTTRLYDSLYGPLAAVRGVPLPPLSAAAHNISVLFVNSHEALSPTFSLPPNVVNVAGYHIDENPPPLPKDLQELLDNSPEGVIYFSMGSILKSSSLEQKTRKELLKVFGSLKQTVLWKFEDQAELPKNVHVRSWFPQLSVLAHPNTRVFITHAGQLSCLEAVAAGVPILAIPVFGDQPSNAVKAERFGYALRAKLGANMAAEIEVKLKELIGNDTYTKQAKYLSRVFRSGPAQPNDLIRFYTKLAIETNGAYHLRSQSLQYAWYERSMLDVVLVALALLVTALATLLLALRFCFRLCFGTSKASKTSTVNKKKKN